MKRKAFILLSSVLLLFACSSLPCASSGDVGSLEEYIIDFSKKAEGYQLLRSSFPENLNAEKFFALLEPSYRNTGIIEKVRQFPVAVYNEGDSYTLVLCDKDRRLTLLKDSGATTDRVDFPYYRQQKDIPCEIK